MKNILIIDDELEICESIKMILEYERYQAEFTTSSKEGLKKLESEEYAVVLLDIQMPEMNGFEILEEIGKRGLSTRIIMISAYSSLENAVKATKLGAFDFVEKPIDREKLLISVRNALQQSELLKENIELKKAASENDIIIGKSKAIKNIIDMIEKVAPTEARILITGENGSGKELVSKAIHKLSSRADKKLIEVNCAAIPNELIESELFGHEKGSFTGALQQRTGKFELAHRGILFLDEIGDMSLQAQAKVLRAIEEGAIERVGGTKKIEVDVRIISATNKNISEEIQKGNFREDLYHRLNVIPIHIPPLRERKEDIPLLIEKFARDICEKNKKALVEFDKSAIETLQNMQWPGNVRELRNLVERIIILVAKNKITSEDVASFSSPAVQNIDNILDVGNSFQEFKEKAERIYILKQLDNNDWNISKTADIIGIQRSHLYSKMKKYNIEKGK